MAGTPNRTLIVDLSEGEHVSGPFAIINAQLGKTRTDKLYLRCLLSDRSGTAPARMWSIDESMFNRLPAEGFVWVEGDAQAYQGEMQIIIQSIDPFDPNEEMIRELLPASKRDPEEMFAELRAIFDTLEHAGAKSLAQAFFDDEPLMAAFRTAPAAKVLHHAYLGGLLEHTLQLCTLADRMLPLYPHLNRDLVLLGLLLHDMAKTRELVYDRAFDYTDRGLLVGHIVDGVILLREKAGQPQVDLPPKALMALEHIILSHHGVPEYGAVKVPSTPEAVFVSNLDDLDAKTEMALVAARRDRPEAADLRGAFTERHWALNTRVYRPDPLGASPAV
ncbi:MAG: HD domain-containing protein [Phycisphaerales bacterium]|jgi:3'-5' exoribonuclease